MSSPPTSVRADPGEVTAGHDGAVGFFTDPTLCIGCKACEVACKEWNDVPADGFVWSGLSYDNTVALGHSTWRHVAFVETELDGRDASSSACCDGAPVSWVFLSDVCKHCEHAGCLESCPTGAIVRTELSTVLVQDDVCNGCGYCVVWCPFGVIDRRPKNTPKAGGAFKCTFCHERQTHGMVPACAKACPTESIQFGPLNELHRRAERRLEELTRRGVRDARIYDPAQSVRGTHAFSLIIGAPQRYGLPPAPQVPTVWLRDAWTAAALTSAAAIAVVALAFLI
jgi:formate dehydrogenase iron-sulfur subunit